MSAPPDTDDAVIVERLSKRYRRRERRRRLVLPWSRLEDEEGFEDEDDELDEDEGDEERPPPAASERWALQELSLRVRQGEIVAVIGATGAGKSTLIKILGGLTPPTSGQARIRGRLAPTAETASSLIRTHWDVRKNVLALARFQDVPRRVALERMDDILAFADLTDHAHTQVSHLSGTMKPKLAFATVLGLSPDVFLADDRLVVGDSAFREKGVHAILEARDRGMVVLFTSHDLGLAGRIADRVLRLHDGRIVDDGEPAEVVRRYEHALSAPSAAPALEGDDGSDDSLSTRLHRTGDPRGRILGARVLDADGSPATTLLLSEPAVLETTVLLRQPGTVARGAIAVYAAGGKSEVKAFRSFQDEAFVVTEPSVYRLRVHLPANLLAATTYRVKVAVLIESGAEPGGRSPTLVLPHALTFSVQGADRGVRPEDVSPDGAVRPELGWRVTAEPAEDAQSRANRP